MGFFRRAAAAALSVGGVGLIADKTDAAVAALQHTDEVTVSVTQTQLGTVALSTWLSGFVESLRKKGVDVVHTTGGNDAGVATLVLRRGMGFKLNPTAPPADSAALVGWMRNQSQSSQWLAVWNARAHLGYEFSEDVVGRENFFWVNALAAIAGINLGRTHDTMQYMFAGSASNAVDRGQPNELAAIRTIDAAYG